MAKDKLRNKYQHELNKLVREINKNVKVDPLWLGRFHIHQHQIEFERFPDGSGAIAYVTYRFIDKKDGYYKDMRRDYAPWMNSCPYNLFKDLNSFIVEDCGVWDENPKPNEKTAISYVNTSIDEVLKKPLNFFNKKSDKED